MCVGLSIGSVDEESQRKGDDPHEKDGNGMDVDEIGRSRDHGALQRARPSDPV